LRKKVNPVVDEAIETLDMRDGPTRRRLIEGAGLFSATATASALIAACTSSSGSNASATKAVVGDLPATPKWRFTFVNHVTDNPFFTPTRYGSADCARVFGLPDPAWTGASSAQSTVPTMLSALNAAIVANSPGIATAVVDATAFVNPIDSALAQGIPVVTYNANGSTANPTNGLAYVGQDLYTSGQAVGARLASLMRKGDTAVGVIAQPGSLNIQPRMDGATAALQAAGMNVMFGSKGLDSSNSLPQEASAIAEFIKSHGSEIQGIFAVDAGDTGFLGASLANYGLGGKVAAGGFDLEPQTLTAIKTGHLDFTVDQSPYMQGFLPTLYLYVWQLSGGLVAPPSTDTGLKFVTRSNAAPYTSNATRFEGSTAAQRYIPHSGAISI
jgi:simple sugar transport system substrate-binding protein